MKRNILFKIILLFMIITQLSYAIDLNNNEVYFTFDEVDVNGTTLIDSSVNSRDAVCLMASGCDTVIGKLLNASDFDGTSDYINTTFDYGAIFNISFSINTWLKPDVVDNSRYIVTTGSTSLGLLVDGKQNANLGYRIYDGTSWHFDDAVDQGFRIGSWQMLTVTYNGTTLTIYRNGNQVDQDSGVSIAQGVGAKTLIGLRAGTGQYYDGLMDEFSIWDKALTTVEIAELYNSNQSFNPYSVSQIQFQNITVNNEELINNSFFNTTILNFEINLTTINTNNNTNISYSINGSSNIQFATNSLNGNFSLNLSDNTYNISFFAINNETNTTTQLYFFTVDTFAPNISINNFTEWNNGYNVTDLNTTLNINCTDPDIVSCEIHWDDLTTTNLFTTSSKLFVNNSNHSFELHAHDSANNTQIVNGTIFINPNNYFRFEFNGTPITNYTLNGTSWNDTAIYKHYELGLGTHTLVFEKLGFQSKNITFTFNNTNELNTTINITNSKILLRIFDREKGTLLTGITQITVQATTGFNGTTITGLLNISNINFINEQYQILAEHSGFESETVFFNYNNQEIINIDIYMLNSSSTDKGIIEIIVKNSLSQFVEGAVCSALEWKPVTSSFISVAQGLTNVNGETLLNIELNTKIYKFSCTKETFTTITNAQIVQIDASSLTIILNDVILVPTPLFENLLTSLTNSTLNTTHQVITYNFADSDGLTVEGCLQIYYVNGNRETFINESCTSSSTGSILLTVNINQTSDVLAKGVLSTNDISNYVTNKLIFKGTGDIAYQLKNIGMDVLIPSIFILLGLGLGILLNNINIAVILMAVGGWSAVAFVPTILSGGIATFISVIVLLMLFGGFRRK